MLISKEELCNKTNKDLIPLECEVCNSTFYKYKNLVMRGLKGTRKVCTCSKECSGKIIGKRLFKGNIQLKCSWCEKEFSRTNRTYKTINLRLNKLPFCSRKCVAKWQYDTGQIKHMRSKLELWIEQQISKDFPNLSVEYNNRKIMGGTELDIYIPILNLAFELNGIYHYKPIYGEENLEIRKIKDFEKAIGCFSRQINLHVINCKEFEHLNESKDRKYYDYIKNIINKKLEEQIPSNAQRI